MKRKPVEEEPAEPPYVGELPRPEPAKAPRSVFVVARPPARVVTLERNVFGRVVRQVAGESPTAASHWNADIWRPL